MKTTSGSPIDMIASNDCRDLIVRFNAAAKESRELAETRAQLTPAYRG